MSFDRCGTCACVWYPTHLRLVKGARKWAEGEERSKWSTWDGRAAQPNHGRYLCKQRICACNEPRHMSTIDEFVWSLGKAIAQHGGWGIGMGQGSTCRLGQAPMAQELVSVGSLLHQQQPHSALGNGGGQLAALAPRPNEVLTLITSASTCLSRITHTLALRALHLHLCPPLLACACSRSDRREQGPRQGAHPMEAACLSAPHSLESQPSLHLLVSANTSASCVSANTPATVSQQTPQLIVSQPTPHLPQSGRPHGPASGHSRGMLGPGVYGASCPVQLP